MFTPAMAISPQPNNPPSPRELGGPHDFWRVNQYEAYLRAREVQEQGGFLFAELGTGSGKSLIVTALGHERKVHVLVHTLGLLEQYEKEYGFVGIKGRNNYACVLPEKVEEWKQSYQMLPTAADCHFSPMKKCPAKNECPYLIQRTKMQIARRSISTYRYAALSSWLNEMRMDLICDEAHAASEEIISYSTLTLSPKDILKFGLPGYPFTTYGEDDKGGILDFTSRETLQTWLNLCLNEIVGQYKELCEDGSESTQWGSQVRNMLGRLQSASARIDTENWFLVFEGAGSNRQMFLRALTSGLAAQRLFSSKPFVMFMSATIGDPEPLARELGIADQPYQFVSFPHPIPPDSRPIYNLYAESMSARNLTYNPRLYQIQARLIWNWIAQLDPTWRGVIVTTSYKKIKELSFWLSKWMPPTRRLLTQGAGEGEGEGGLTKMIEGFVNDQRPGDIALGTIQGWGSGLNFYGDTARFIVVAGVPHVNPTDAYAKARRKISGGERYQMWVTYNAIMQACGRVSRGEPDGNGGYLLNVAALADGMCTTNKAISYYGPWFREAFR